MNTPTDDSTTDPRVWTKDGWTARVLKNEDDDGWAVSMTRVGDSEPALVGPWTMGRDKKNPKPLDQQAFMTLVKTASEVLMRHEQAAKARLHKTLSFVAEGPSDGPSRRVRVDLDIAPDDDDPHAILAAFDEATGDPIRSGRVEAGFKLSAASAGAWLRGRGD